MTNERAIQWLEMYANKPVKWDDYSEETKEIRQEAERQVAEAFKMAINALKEQEPHVMTLDDAINSEMVWVECFNGDGGYGTCRLVEIYGMVAAEVFMLKNKYPERNRLNPKKYLSDWRCWTLRPTVEQMNNIHWEERDNGEKAEY